MLCKNLEKRETWWWSLANVDMKTIKYKKSKSHYVLLLYPGSWIWYSNPPPPLLTIMARLRLESVKVILYIRMLFREGELGSPSSRRLARRGDDGGLGPGDSRQRGDRTGPTSAQPYLPGPWVCKYLGPVQISQNCEGRGKSKLVISTGIRIWKSAIFGKVVKVIA